MLPAIAAEIALTRARLLRLAQRGANVCASVHGVAEVLPPVFTDTQILKDEASNAAQRLEDLLAAYRRGRTDGRS